jgi:hypothetical protein
MSETPLLLPSSRAVVVRRSRRERYIRIAAMALGIVAVLVGLADVSSRAFRAAFSGEAVREAFAPLPTVQLPGE